MYRVKEGYPDQDLLERSKLEFGVVKNKGTTDTALDGRHHSPRCPSCVGLAEVELS
jgi:hypothetical protein